MKKILFCVLLLFSTVINAQLIRTGNLTTFVDSLLTNLPDSSGDDKNKYVSPNSTDRATFANVLTDIVNSQYSTAHTNAASIGYQLLQYTDNSSSPNKTYYVLLKTGVSTNYWGTFIINQNADRQRLVIQSPHPKYDTYTGAQGFYIFKNVGARAFFLSGTHRCNSNTASTCDGTSTVCTGSSAAFRISDQAHSEESLFQRGTETLSNLISNLIVIQVHGFSKVNDDPDVIISNGTKINPSGTDYVNLIKTNLLVEDNTLTFKIPNVDTDWDRLNGTTNLQGRFINGSGDPCTTAPVSSTGRFVHIEQKKDGLRNPSSDWTKLSNAIANSVALDALPVELTSFTAQQKYSYVTLNFQTAAEVNNYGFEIERSSLSNTHLAKNLQLEAHNWIRIGFLQGHGNSNSPKHYTFEDNNPPAEKLQYRLKQIDFDGKYEYSKTIEVDVAGPANYQLLQNYPNPFNPVTTISYEIPKYEFVSLKIFDLLGKEIATLVNEHKPAGNHTALFKLNPTLASGMYFYQLTAGSFVDTKKLIILK
ncbi:MAG: T9SS type A sorting domain-containing protein [Melioribacteraceae bacterium]